MLPESSQSLFQLVTHLYFIYMLILLFLRNFLPQTKLLYALVELSPVIFTGVVIVFTFIFTGVIVVHRKILSLIVFLVRTRPLTNKSRLCKVFLVVVFVSVPLVGNLLREMMLLDAMVESFSFFPSVFQVSLLASLKIFIFVAEKLIVILAFFDDLADMILFVFGRFL